MNNPTPAPLPPVKIVLHAHLYFRAWGVYLMHSHAAVLRVILTNKNPVGDRTGFVGVFTVLERGDTPTLAYLALGGKNQ